MFGIAIELRGECPRCGQPVMVNALSERIHCPACQSDRPYPYSAWADLLESALEQLRPATEPGQGGTTTVLGENWHLLYARFDPYCYGCKHDFDMRVVQASPSPYACPACGTPWHHREAPAEARAAMPALRWLVAEEPGQIPGAGPDTPAPAASAPILFQCMGCGGPLRVDGSERVVTCGHCDASNYLPDDLWLRMHPAPTVRRWFLWLDAEALPAVEDEEEDSEDIDDEELAIALEDVLEEIDPAVDGTMEGHDDGDPLGLDLPPRPAPGPPVRDTRPSDRAFWLMVGLALILMLGSAAAWFAVFGGAQGR
jgi:Zn finger protein HypA/HybF involved in hydrogenase expression